jgi:NAD(P)-dependent dehydrogenase (short-subunit alcohol dehydrogenase family)
MTDRLQDKVAIFGVGPGWGNGKATATLFGVSGAHVICVDVDQAAAETTDIITRESGQASTHFSEVTRSAAVSHLVASVVRENGRIDVPHNNVGYARIPHDAGLSCRAA